jgi:hypothetical protein
LKWRGSSQEINSGDKPTVDVIGINSTGAETVLMNNLNLTQQDVVLTSINANTYPI